MKLFTTLVLTLMFTTLASAQSESIHINGRDVARITRNKESMMLTRTITVLNSPREDEALIVNSSLFGFSFETSQSPPIEGSPINLNGNVADSIATAINKFPIGCTASSDGTIVTLTSDSEIMIVYEGEALEVSP